MEFPEARIYEETLNILLYESHDGRGPDNALLEATGGAAGRSHHLDEDEERERIERVRRIHIKRPDDRTHHHQWPLPLDLSACVYDSGRFKLHTRALHILPPSPFEFYCYFTSVSSLRPPELKWASSQRSDFSVCVYLSVLCCFMTFVFVFYSCVERKKCNRVGINLAPWIFGYVGQTEIYLVCRWKTPCAFFLLKNKVLMAPQAKPIFTPPPFFFFFQKNMWTRSTLCGTKLICGLMRGHGCSQRGHKVALFES